MSRSSKNRGRVASLKKVYWRVSDAREVLDLWRHSGTNLTAFAREHGLCRNRLARWRDRLSREQEPEIRFHPVRLLAEADSESGSRSRNGKIEVVLRSSRRVVVHPGFDPAVLVEVVRVLEGLEC